jgi:Zn-dependent protease
VTLSTFGCTVLILQFIRFQKLLNCLTFQPLDYERVLRSLFQKRVTLYVYVYIIATI